MRPVVGPRAREGEDEDITFSDPSDDEMDDDVDDDEHSYARYYREIVGVPVCEVVNCCRPAAA